MRTARAMHSRLRLNRGQMRTASLLFRSDERLPAMTTRSNCRSSNRCPTIRTNTRHPSGLLSHRDTRRALYRDTRRASYWIGSRPVKSRTRRQGLTIVLLLLLALQADSILSVGSRSLRGAVAEGGDAERTKYSQSLAAGCRSVRCAPRR